MRVIVAVIFFAILGATTVPATSTEFMEKFERDYQALGANIMTNDGMVSEVAGIMYKKDVATFYFTEGKFIFQRFVDNRPTMAVFVGKGSVQIDVPPAVERQSMQVISGDSVVNEEFDLCFIRFGDNFDKLVQKRFPSHSGGLSAKEFRRVKKAVGERFFTPSIDHYYDNYFQLLQSVYERSDDGYFWAGFNRWVYRFDPNSVEETSIYYEHEVTDFHPRLAARFQRKQANRYANIELSEIEYPLQSATRTGEMEFGGMDGYKIERAAIAVGGLINEDSLRFLTAHLDPLLSLDSVTANVGRVGVKRRKDFRSIGIILPGYLYRGDSLSLTFWYHGSDYQEMIPLLGNLQYDFSENITVYFPRGADLVVPNRSCSEPHDQTRDRCQILSETGVSGYTIGIHLTGYDTLVEQTSSGLTLNHFSDWKPLKEEYRGILRRAFDFYHDILGPPIAVDTVSVYRGFWVFEASRGYIFITERNWSEETGGFCRQAGWTAARQWFSNQINPRSYRDAWIDNAVVSYLTLMFIQEELGNEEYYTNLLAKRRNIRNAQDRDHNMPIGLGGRALSTFKNNKGAWVMHMLRMMMFDARTQSDSSFHAFLRDFMHYAHENEFTNRDFIRIAEKHYGGKLDWFFDQWVFCSGLPEYKATYDVVQRDGGWVIDFDVHTEGVREMFVMPMIFRLEFPQGTAFLRKAIGGTNYQFKLGPYDTKPDKVYFNEFLSVLADYEVKMR